MRFKLIEEANVGAEFKCRSCGAIVVADIYDVTSNGPPICGRCDVDMKLIRTGKIEEAEEKS